MSSYIEREAAVKFLRSRKSQFVDDVGKGWNAGIEAAVEAVGNLPEADVVPVRHGRWERRNMDLWDEDYAYVCSACGEVWTLIDSTPEDNNMNYCPNCGALMREVENGEK